MRFCLDIHQGGAMIDLRPFAAKLIRPVGVGTKYLQDASYPYLVQSLYRAGYFTHYAGEGAVKSCKISSQGEEVDLCTCRTLASMSEEGDTKVLTLNTVSIQFNKFTLQLQSIFRLKEATGEIEIIRRVVDISDPNAEVGINEYITGCFGTTEYPEDMTGITLTLRGLTGSQTIKYAYQSREAQQEGIHLAEVIVPQLDTRLTMHSVSENEIGYYREGFAFSPMYTIGIIKNIKGKGELRTWLKVEKAS
jgi:hypothetical protein